MCYGKPFWHETSHSCEAEPIASTIMAGFSKRYPKENYADTWVDDVFNRVRDTYTGPTRAESEEDPGRTPQRIFMEGTRHALVHACEAVGSKGGASSGDGGGAADDETADDRANRLSEALLREDFSNESDVAPRLFSRFTDVCLAKPATFEPLAYTHMIAGRPVQVEPIADSIFVQT